MKEKLLNNLEIKVLAVVLAVIVWILVANVEDYTVTKQIANLEVEVVNEDAVTDQKMVYDIVEGSNVSFTVKGRRTVVDGLSSNDFKATADLSELSITNSVQIRIEPVDASIRKDLEIICTNSTMKVELEEKAEQTLPITVNLTGAAAEGYAAVAKAATPNMIKISGPKSVVNKIKGVQVTVAVNGETEDIVTQAEPVFIDSDGDEVHANRIKRNIELIDVMVSIRKTKEVPVRIGTTGEVADGYRRIGEIEFQPTSVLIAGETWRLDMISAIDITDISIEGATESIEQAIDLDDYLPEGIVVVDGNEQVMVKIEIEKMVEKTIPVDVSEITLLGKKSDFNYQVSFVGGNAIRFRGLNERIQQIGIGDFSPSADVAALEEGEHQVKVVLVTPEGIEVMTDLELMIRVERKMTPEPTTGEVTTEEPTTEEER